jgi:low affinity Fe/Cu permease
MCLVCIQGSRFHKYGTTAQMINVWAQVIITDICLFLIKQWIKNTITLKMTKKQR